MMSASITLLGGPTAIIELAGLRFLTDPTFDGPGEYALPHVTLRKTARPALPAERLAHRRGTVEPRPARRQSRHFRPRFSSEGRPRIHHPAGAGRLGGNAVGLSPWESRELEAPDGDTLQITATPARHGPIGIEPFSGDVIGFVLSSKSGAFRPVYVTGDTVWFEGVAEVQRRFRPGLVLLFAGAAQTRGKFNLTMNANDAIEAAQAFAGAAIVPLHTDGWAHFTETADDLEHAFKALGHAARLRRIEPGVPAAFPL